MRRAHGVLLVLGLCVARLAHAQGSAQTTEPGTLPYLLRLQRAHRLESVCVLLNGNGQYHLERHTFQKVRVFEGSLRDNELRDIIRMVSGDRLFNLQQKDIPDLMLKSDDDQVMLDIHRPGSWQQLTFTDSASRQPFRDTIDPLLKWLDAVNKRKGLELSEQAGRNNCLPPSKQEFSQRKEVQAQQSVTSDTPTANVPPQPPTYVLQMTDNRMVNYQIQVSCLLVATSGAYHLVKQSKSHNKGLSSMVLDGTFAPSELASLRTLLDSPDLANQPDENQDPELVLTGFSSESYLTRLTIPRAGGTQKLAAWKSYRIINQTLSRSVDDHSTKLLAPLREWLKANLNEKSAVPTVAPSNARCVPGS